MMRKKNKTARRAASTSTSALTAQLAQAINAVRSRRRGAGKELRAGMKDALAKKLEKRDARWQKKIARVEKKRDELRDKLKAAKQAAKDARKELKALQRDTKRLLKLIVPMTIVRNENEAASSNVQGNTPTPTK